MKTIDCVLNKFTPIKMNTCVFMAFSGKCCDNPYYLSIELHNKAPWLQQHWIVKKDAIDKVPSFATAHVFGSKDARSAINSSEIIIDNVYGPFACQVFNNLKSRVVGLVFKLFCWKKKQRVYSVWHGNPIKKIGRDQVGNDVVDFVCGQLTIISNSRKMKEIMEHVTFGKTKNVLLGMPRNDLLFEETDAADMKKRLKLPCDKKVVLYAPTFRNDGKDVENKNIARSGLQQLSMIDFRSLFDVLEKKFGTDFVFVARFHYHVSNMVDWEKLQREYPNRIINGNISDEMALYLKCSDVLITDASSCAFDYLLTKKPCFLFFPDLQNYEEHERGFYYDVRSLPFPLSRTFSELLTDIRNFDINYYRKKADIFMKDNQFVDDGNASRRIVELILKEKGD